MGSKQQGRGQKRAAKVAARRRKVRTSRPVVTVPGLDSYEPGPVAALEAVEEMRYAVAEIRTIRQVGPHEGNPLQGGDPLSGDPRDVDPLNVDPQWLEVLERNVEALAGADENDLVVEIIDDRVRRAVVDTLAASSPEPAREEVRCLVASDGEMAPADADPEGLGGAPAQGLAFATLIGWLANRGPRPIPSAARTRVPEWVRATLGAEAGDAVDRLIGVIGSTEEREQAIGPLADELGDDFLAALMWIAAALVALYADGDPNAYLAFPEGVPA